MAGRPAPPSFSSFPEPSTSRAPAITAPAPPSFGSFPSPPRESLALPPRPRKRSKHDPADFLDSIGGELGIGPSTERRPRDDDKDRRRSKESRESDRSHRSQRHYDEADSRGSRHGKERERDTSRERRRHKESKRGGSERERDRGHKDARTHRESRQRSDGAHGERERDTDYGPKVSFMLGIGQVIGTDPGARQMEKRYRYVDEAHSAADNPASFTSATPASAPPPGERPVFYESRRGDENNIRYGGLHRGDIPRYRRAAGGKVLGLNDGLRITRETAYTGRGVEIAPLNRFRVRIASDAGRELLIS